LEKVDYVGNRESLLMMEDQILLYLYLTRCPDFSFWKGLGVGWTSNQL